MLLKSNDESDRIEFENESDLEGEVYMWKLIQKIQILSKIFLVK